MEVLKLSIGTNIKTLREQHNMSQEELGKIAGVTDKAVSTWENDIKIPRMGAIQRIADYFGIRKSDIIEDKNNNIDTPMPHQNLISKYEQLNESGQAKLMERLDELLEHPKYINK